MRVCTLMYAHMCVQVYLPMQACMEEKLVSGYLPQLLLYGLFSLFFFSFVC